MQTSFIFFFFKITKHTFKERKEGRTKQLVQDKTMGLMNF